MQRDIVKDFVNKRVMRGYDKPHGHNGRKNLYYNGDTLYSYGRHFPLLVRTPFGYLLNGDRYSNTTSKHQGECRRYATIVIPFSVLTAARIPHEPDNCFRLVDNVERRDDIIGYSQTVIDKTITPEEYETLNHRQQRKCGSNGGWVEGTSKLATEYYIYKKLTITPAQYQSLPETEREIWSENTERRPEHAVIEWGGSYYLSGMDNNNYFMCQLPRPVETVKEALLSLIPPEIRGMSNLIRQGEWFFVQQTFDNTAWRRVIKIDYKNMQRNFVLPLDRDDGNRHTATRGIVENGFIYVSGSVRHPEHKTLHLSKADNPIIYRAYHNTTLSSFSASGNVD